jgi:hypothetical protein
MLNGTWCSVEEIGAQPALHVLCRAALTPNRALRIPRLAQLPCARENFRNAERSEAQ